MFEFRTHTPDAGRLTVAPVTENNIVSGESIAAFFASNDLTCECVDITDAPQLVKYHLLLSDISEYNENKIKRIIKIYGARNHCLTSFENSNYGDFAMVVTRSERRPLYLSDLMPAPIPHHYAAVIGKDDNGEFVTIDMTTAPHVLIAGTTGSGKSVLLNTLIASTLFCANPIEVGYIFIDVKRVELAAYSKLPHNRFRHTLITSVNGAKTVLQMQVEEMTKRYKKLERMGVKSVTERDGKFNPNHIYIVIDELADLMLVGKNEIESYIVRLAQLGRAAGIHLIIATQRPTANVLTGLIKANIPTKIALTTANATDSITILGHGGAEKLTGRGDGIIKFSDSIQERRFQAAYTPPADIDYIVTHWMHDFSFIWRLTHRT